MKKPTPAAAGWRGIGRRAVSEILREKLNTPAGYAFFVALALASAAIVARAGLSGGVLFVVLLVGIPLGLTVMLDLRFGIILLLIMAFLVLGMKRALSGIPLGLAMDALVAVMGFGLFVRQTKERDWSFAANPISRIIGVWILYTFLEVANPVAESRMAWVYTIRGTAGYMAMYFVVLYSLKSVKDVTLILKVWIALAFLGAFWGLYQEYVGLLPFEMQSVIDEGKMNLWIVNGHFRKFSFYSDPMVFGIVTSYSAILCFALARGAFSLFKRGLLFACGIFMSYAMLFSGTRAAYVLPGAALFFYAVLTAKKSVLLSSLMIGLVALVFLNIPSSNEHVRRFQSAFHPSDDASYKVRAQNQAFIQPYIQTHPFGGGLGSVGVWGQRFSPNSALAKFPPDSGYIRTAVEMGWIGLLLYFAFLYTVFHVGITDYHRIRDPRLKTYSAAMLTLLFTLLVANFPQEALIQFPTSLIIYVVIAIINKLPHFEGRMS